MRALLPIALMLRKDKNEQEEKHKFSSEKT